MRSAGPLSTEKRPPRVHHKGFARSLRPDVPTVDAEPPRHGHALWVGVANRNHDQHADRRRPPLTS
jgi:hypothetical protein